MAAISSSANPAVGDREVALPGGTVARQLALAVDRVAVVAERACESLREPGCVVPESPCVRGDVDRERPVYAAGVEVVHRLLPIDDPADRDRVGNLWMVVVRALEQKPLILKPLERGLSVHEGAGKRWMRGLGRPRTNQPLPTLKL